MDGITATSSLHRSLKTKPEAPLSLDHATNANASSDHARNPKLWKASVQFEAIFLEQLLATMKKTIPDSGFLEKGFAQDIQSDMLNHAVAESIASHSQTGIARTLYQQLEKNLPTAGAGHNPVQANASPTDTDSIKGQYNQITGGDYERN